MYAVGMSPSIERQHNTTAKGLSAIRDFDLPRQVFSCAHSPSIVSLQYGMDAKMKKE
jgi:hypothetical protein